MEPEQETFVNGTRQLSGRELKIAAKVEMLEKKIARQVPTKFLALDRHDTSSASTAAQSCKINEACWT